MFHYSVGGYSLGSLITEGKTKQVYEINGLPEEVILINKDRITAGDGVKAHDLQGKAAISTQTNAKVFELLNMIGKFIPCKNDIFLMNLSCSQQKPLFFRNKNILYQNNF